MGRQNSQIDRVVERNITGVHVSELYSGPDRDVASSHAGKKLSTDTIRRLHSLTLVVSEIAILQQLSISLTRFLS